VSPSEKIMVFPQSLPQSIIILFFIVVVMLYMICMGVFIEIRARTGSRYVPSMKDSIFQFGFTIHSHRGATTTDAWLSLIWPIFFLRRVLKIVLKATVLVINDTLWLPCLLFGIQYKSTKMYRYIDQLTN